MTHNVKSTILHYKHTPNYDIALFRFETYTFNCFYFYGFLLVVTFFIMFPMKNFSHYIARDNFHIWFLAWNALTISLLATTLFSVFDKDTMSVVPKVRPKLNAIYGAWGFLVLVDILYFVIGMEVFCADTYE